MEEDELRTETPNMLSVRVAAALARTLPRRAAFVSIFFSRVDGILRMKRFDMFLY